MRTRGLVAALLVLVGAHASAAAQPRCTGDCDGDGIVAVGEVIVGVSVVLGLQPVSACAALADEHGLVDIARLIRSVGASLEGCPNRAATPSPTASAMAGNTPTSTPRSATPTPDQGLCILQAGVCAGGPRDGKDCSRNGECPSGGCVTTGAVSKVELNTAGLPVPLSFPLRGVIDIEAGTPNADGSLPVTCRLERLEPVIMPSVGVLCLTSSSGSCARDLIDCAGGVPLSIDLLTDDDVGSCAGNAACAVACDQYCSAGGRVPQSSGCVGYCTAGPEQRCDADTICPSGAGPCQGGGQARNHPGTCECECVNVAAPGPGRAGDISCSLSVSSVVEALFPCDGSDVVVRLGDVCIPLTSASTTSRILNANHNPVGCPGGPPCALPVDGPIVNIGQPLSCDVYRNDGPFTGLSMVGVVNLLDTSLGDVAEEFSVVCR